MSVQRINEIFPTVESLESASLYDLAAFVLNHLNAQQTRGFHIANVVTLGDAYIDDNQAPGPPHERRDRARRVIAEAIGYLISQNFVAPDGERGVSHGLFVTRLGRTIRTRQDFSSYARAGLLPRDLLRADLAEIATPLFLAGRYDDAVSAAFKRVEIAVRELGKFSNEDYGVTLMRKAFGENGSMTDTNAVKSERVALSNLFAGAIGYFKNPLSHRDLGIDDARLAASRILFANELIAIAVLQYRTLHQDEVAAATPL